MCKYEINPAINYRQLAILVSNALSRVQAFPRLPLSQHIRTPSCQRSVTDITFTKTAAEYNDSDTFVKFNIKGIRR